MVAVAASGWGTWPLVVKRAPMPSSLVSMIMMTVLTLASVPVMFRDRVRVRATRRQWVGIAWLGVGDAANAAFFFAAYQRTTVAIAVLTHYLAPIFIALTAPIVIRERPTVRTFTSVGIAFVGLVMLVEPWRTGFSREDAVGAMLGGASAVFYCSNVLVNKRLTGVFSGSEMMFFHGLVAVPILLVLARGDLSYLGTVSPHVLGIVLLGALGPGALCGLLFVWGLRRIAASHASVLTLLEPLVAVVLAVALLGEDIGAVPIAGGVLILVGALVVITVTSRE
jgi:drug/metabolite transporter (DMT)-like permease